MKTIGQIIEEAGGIDGFLKQSELMAPIRTACDGMRFLMASAVRKGSFDLDDYNSGVRLLLAISTTGNRLAAESIKK